MAEGNAGDRAQGTPTPWRAAAYHRRRRASGHRVPTNTVRGQLADLELRHRRRARCEDRIRCAKDTGLNNLPLHDFTQNEIWCAIVALACKLTAWMQMLALTPHEARRWEPKRLRLRLFSIAGRLARTGRSVQLHLSGTRPGPALSSTRSPRSAPRPRPPEHTAAAPPTRGPEDPRTVEPAPEPERHRVNHRTLAAQSHAPLDDNVETIKNTEPTKDRR